MARRRRMIFMLIGLALLAISLAALMYAFAPQHLLSDQTPILPTLLTVPAGGGG